MVLIQMHYDHFDFRASISPLCPVCVPGATWISHVGGDVEERGLVVSSKNEENIAIF